jgi:hypothetical protein
MLKLLGLFFWGMLSLSIIGALGFNEAIGEYLGHSPNPQRPSPVELQALAYSFLVWASGVVVWVLGARIWRRVKN